MLKTRFRVRQEAEMQKRQMMSTVETMKKKGNFDMDELSKLGINVDNIEVKNNSMYDWEGSIISSPDKKESISKPNSTQKSMQQSQMMNILQEKEQYKKQEREDEIEKELDTNKKLELENIHNVENQVSDSMIK